MGYKQVVETTSELVVAKKLSRFIKKRLESSIVFGVKYNSKFTERDILSSVIQVCVTQDFAEGSLNGLNLLGCTLSSADTLLRYVKNLGYEQVTEMFNQASEKVFNEASEKGLFDNPVDLALDFHLIPFYGKPDKWVVQSKAKLGTKWFYRFATVSIVEDGERFTLKTLFAPPLRNEAKIVRELLEHAKSRVSVRRVYLDREFDSVEVRNIISDLNLEYEMPVRKNTKIKKVIEKHKDSELPVVEDYEMKHGDETARFTLVLVESTHDENKVSCFSTNIPVDEDNALELVNNYRKRWGIETSYRVIKGFRGMTTSTNVIIRVFYFLFSVLLYNIWVLLNACTGEWIPVKHVRLLYLADLIVSFRIDAEKVALIMEDDDSISVSSINQACLLVITLVYAKPPAIHGIITTHYHEPKHELL